MSHDDNPVVTLSPSGRQFSSHHHTSILEAGLSAGITLPYRCSNGSCGECRARILSGDVEMVQHHDYTLTQAEKAAGVVLLCSHRALNNLAIEVSEAGTPEDIPQQQLNTRLCHCETNDNVMVIRLKILRGKALWYLAGQYAMIHLPGIPACLLPIASCPCETGYLEFHIPETMKPIRRVVEKLGRRDRILVGGPQGNFVIKEDSLASTHHIFIANSHQFAAIKPMIEHIIATEEEPRCTLLWQAKKHYKSNLCRSWNDAFDWFSYRPLDNIESVQNELALLLKDSTTVRIYASMPSGEHTTLRQLCSTSANADYIADQQS